MKYKAYTRSNYKQIPQISKLTEREIFDIDVVSTIFPFKTNNYVIDKLIDWNNYKTDPLFVLNFPQKGMLKKEHYQEIAKMLRTNTPQEIIKKRANEIHFQLNPHTSGQLEQNIPQINGKKLYGFQHKYKQTMLIFPSHGQTCHAYCTFCFRWPQFIGVDELKYATQEVELMVEYIKHNPQITDVLFTGGDPLVMKASKLRQYIEPLLDDSISNVQTIRIGTKSLAFWPYRFTQDDDSQELLEIFRTIVSKGRNLAFMAHFCHPNELETEEVKEAIKQVLSTGAIIRTQSPVLKHINDDPEIWAKMLRMQVNLNLIPYYMFIPRDTGARDYFSLSLEEAWNVFRKAYQKVSGICRTIRGPVMSATPGKVQVLGVAQIKDEKVFVLRFIQGRNPDWVCRPFFAKYNKKALWLTDLEPAFGEKKFFFERQLEKFYHSAIKDIEYYDFE